MADKIAVFQFECDRKRWQSGPFVPAFSIGENSLMRLKAMAQTAAIDTLLNGGTFVMVVTATKVTMIQRADAEEI